MQQINFIRPAAIAGLIVLIPFIAMQFTSEVNWSLSDFVVMGGLIFITGLLSEFVLIKVKDPVQRISLVVLIIFVLLVVWADLAVGIFNIPGISGS